MNYYWKAAKTKIVTKQDLENVRQLYDVDFKSNENKFINYYDSDVYYETSLRYEQLNEYYKDFIKRKYNIIKQIETEHKPVL